LGFPRGDQLGNDAALMSWFGQLLFPNAKSYERRRKTRVLWLTIIVTLFIGAVLTGALYLMNKPLFK